MTPQQRLFSNLVTAVVVGIGFNFVLFEFNVHPMVHAYHHIVGHD